MNTIGNLNKLALMASVTAALWSTVPLPASAADVRTVPTRLGGLTLENGYPSRDTADRLYDEMDNGSWRCAHRGAGGRAVCWNSSVSTRTFFAEE